MDETYVSCAEFELRFWTQVLGDHARFIRDSLAPSEHVEVGRAVEFVSTFDAFLRSARQTLSDTSAAALSQHALDSIEQLRAFKLHLLRRHLQRELKSTLPPTFLNHMVNELEEGLRVIHDLSQGDRPSRGHSLHHHLLWLPDASGHASSLQGSVDLVERRIQEKCGTFTHHFDQFHLKALELAGYLRANVEEFPALARFNAEVNLEIALFHGFLQELLEMELTNQLLGSVTPLMPDHMAREECYYLKKLSEADASTAATTDAACDPIQPRIRDPRVKG